jgi:energy-coupling factor transporter ATP-binding protein EcfA2
MQLKSLRIEGDGKPEAWQLTDLTLRSQNLVVGRNASGKSSVLLRIHLLAQLVSGDIKISDLAFLGDTHWIANFQGAANEVTYELAIRESQVVTERFSHANDVLLDRGQGGFGKIRYHKAGKEDPRDQEFQTPNTELAVVSRRDSKRHPFFQELYEWGFGLLALYCATDLGKSAIMVPSGVAADNTISERLGDMPTFRVLQKGLLLAFSEEFKTSIINDMSTLGYDLTDIGLRSAPELVKGPVSVSVSFGPQQTSATAGIPVVIFVKERDLVKDTPQYNMSWGMFRALAILIRLNFAKFASKPTCVVIDDIGEGLDHERASELISLVYRKAEELGFQVIMATNDRFVMNSVPLEDWTVLRRTGSSVDALNCLNRGAIFDEFKKTGLTNFDFFAMDFTNPNSDLLDD